MAGLSVTDMTITVCGTPAPLKLVKDRRAKCLRLSFNDRSRSFRLSLPRWVSVKQGMTFLAERQALMEKWWQTQTAAPPLESGADIMWRGTTVRLNHNPDGPRAVRLEPDGLHIGGPAELLAARLLRWMKAEAKRDLTDRTQARATAHGLSISRVTVRDMTSRWGSCISGGRISLNWRLILAPDAIRDYVVAHELAHLAHMNHSPAFWREVARLGGDLGVRGWFKANGAALMRFGA